MSRTGSPPGVIGDVNNNNGLDVLHVCPYNKDPESEIKLSFFFFYLSLWFVTRENFILQKVSLNVTKKL